MPNAHLAIVEHGKVVDYLLNAGHPDNGGKALFFARLGFTREEAGTLIRGLKEVATGGNIVDSSRSKHGDKYVVDGVLYSDTIEGRHGAVRTVWVVDLGSSEPRLVTAYPGRE